MSRSYHVTKKQAERAFRDGDATLGYLASEKRGVKQAEAKLRRVAGLKQRHKNSVVVSSQRVLTARVRANRDQCI